MPFALCKKMLHLFVSITINKCSLDNLWYTIHWSELLGVSVIGVRRSYGRAPFNIRLRSQSCSILRGKVVNPNLSTTIDWCSWVNFTCSFVLSIIRQKITFSQKCSEIFTRLLNKEHAKNCLLPHYKIKKEKIFFNIWPSLEYQSD